MRVEQLDRLGQPDDLRAGSDDGHHLGHAVSWGAARTTGSWMVSGASGSNRESVQKSVVSMPSPVLVMSCDHIVGMSTTTGCVAGNRDLHDLVVEHPAKPDHGLPVEHDEALDLVEVVVNRHA